MKHEEPEEHDELWELLGKAKEPKDAPFFASKVLRAIHEEPKQLGFWQWLRRSWLVSSVATATAVIAAVIALNDGPIPATPGLDNRMSVSADPLSELGEAMSAMTDPDDMGTPLPDLLATEDHSVWLQADPSSL